MRCAPTHRPADAASWRAAGLWRPETLWDALAATAAAHPARTALVDGDVRLGFAALAAHAARLAGGLVALGLRPGDAVVLQLPNWWETVALLLATLRCGAVAVPVVATHGLRELGFALDATAAALLVAGGPGLAAARDAAASRPHLRRVVVRAPAAAGETALDALPAAPAPPPATDASAVALVLHTSGTTAEPKGVLHSHETLLYEARSLLPVHGFVPGDVVLMPAPLAHMAGLVHALLVPAVAATTAVLCARWEPEAAVATMAAERVSWMVGPPTFLRDVLAHADRPLPAFRLFSCGGSGVDPALVREATARLGCVVKRVYGSTEFPTLTTSGPDDPPARRADSDGRAIGASQVRIVDEAGRPLPPDVEGEIVARGPDGCLGYRDPAHTAEAFDADGWFHTGDLGRIDADGWLRVTGRAKDVVIRKGETVSAREIEEAVASHPAVAEVAVVALPDVAAGEIACAVVRARDGHPAPDLAAVAAHCRTQGLATRKLPERLVVVDALPRGPGGKILKRTLVDRLRRESP